MKSWLRYRTVRHLLFWGGVSAFFLLLQLPSQWLGGLQFYDARDYVFFMLPTIVLGTYPLLYGVLPRLLSRQHQLLSLAWLVGWAVSSAVLASLLRALYTFVLAPRLYQALPASPFSWVTLLTHGTGFSFVALLIVAVGASAVKVFNGWYAQQQQQQLLLQHKLQAELQLLKAQLQPTFLFNTLHLLHRLTVQKAPDSPATVLHLAALLRYTLYESPQGEVPLADEIEMIRHYVALEQRRLGALVEVSVNFSGALAAPTIAPLVLLPFVESAFGGVTGAQPKGTWISIDLVARANALIFKVITGWVEIETASREVPDLSRIRQRLARLYPGRHELKVVAEPDTLLIALQVRLAPPQPPNGPATAGQVPAAQLLSTAT